MKLTLVCFAVKEEAGPFARSAGSLPQVTTLLTGMGRANAEASLKRALENATPGLMISAGFAGGLRPGLSSGAVLFEADGLPELAQALSAAGAQPGRFHCAGKVATTPAEKNTLRQQTGADAVEMESQWLRALAQVRAIPAATVRVILDPAEEELPLDFNAVMTPGQELSRSKLAGALLKSPGKIAALLRLQKQSAAAAERLAEVLKNALANSRPLVPPP